MEYKCELDSTLSSRLSLLISLQFIKLPFHCTLYPSYLCSGLSLCWSLLLPHHSCLNSTCPSTYISNASPFKHFLLLTTRNHLFNTLVALASGICPLEALPFKSMYYSYSHENLPFSFNGSWILVRYGKTGRAQKWLSWRQKFYHTHSPLDTGTAQHVRLHGKQGAKMSRQR